jgi:hypothetical protein
MLSHVTVMTPLLLSLLSSGGPGTRASAVTTSSHTGVIPQGSTSSLFQFHFLLSRNPESEFPQVPSDSARFGRLYCNLSRNSPESTSVNFPVSKKTKETRRYDMTRRLLQEPAYRSNATHCLFWNSYVTSRLFQFCYLMVGQLLTHASRFQ